MSLIETIKKCQKEQLNQMQLTNIIMGVVSSLNPLEIETEQSQVFKEDFLILTRNVTDYKIEMSVDHTTEAHTHTHTIEDTYTGSGEASEETHHHDYVGRKVFKMHNALKVGEIVLLIKQQGGQKYFVIDRLGGD